MLRGIVKSDDSEFPIQNFKFQNGPTEKRGSLDSSILKLEILDWKFRIVRFQIYQEIGG